MPLGQDRSFEKVAALTGHASLGKRIEWYSRFVVKLDSILPSADDVLKDVLKHQAPLQHDDVQLLEHPDIADRLNTELCARLANVHADKAWSALKSLRPTDGLEAFRWVYKNVTKQTPQQLLNEHRYLNGLHGPKSIQDISGWLYAWEDRMRVLQDRPPPQYSIGAQREGTWPMPECHRH